MHVVEADFLDVASLRDLPQEIDAAYYLIRSMGSGGDFAPKKERCAGNFPEAAKAHGWKRIIYLGGLAADDGPLFKHLTSRRRVEGNPLQLRSSIDGAEGVHHRRLGLV